MTKKVNIIKSKSPSDFASIEDYLLYTYGATKLENSNVNSNPTFLDVVGYTLNKGDLESIEGAFYELEEIEDMRDGTLKANEQEG
ncbi:hypothetical protein [Brevibacillus brevis]|uniref:hypothetical protein n=1 Tax=Brevibacillus brevis TaxID=1393 RepID=UPI000B1F79A6|nr:hypothetical protein [Brevibacillus brevis]